LQLPPHQHQVQTDWHKAFKKSHFVMRKYKKFVSSVLLTHGLLEKMCKNVNSTDIWWYDYKVVANS